VLLGNMMVQSKSLVMQASLAMMVQRQMPRYSGAGDPSCRLIIITASLHLHQSTGSGMIQTTEGALKLCVGQAPTA
jgi:hypothetical protein